MKRTILGMTEAGEPLLQQASEAIRRHREAESKGSAREEVERLRLLAKSLFQVVTDYQLRTEGAEWLTLH